MAEVFQTHTMVDDEKTALKQKLRTQQRSEALLNAMQIYVQMLVVMCFAMFSRLGTTVWQSVLIVLPICILLTLLGRVAQGRRGAPWAKLVLLPALLMDILLSLLALTALVRTYVLPFTSMPMVVALTCATVFVTLLSSGASALPRLTLIIAPMLFVFVVWGMVTSVGNILLSNLTPFMGQGIEKTLLMALMPLGCVWRAPLRQVMEENNENKENKAPRALVYGSIAVLLAALTALITACTWPMESLLRPLSPAKRMMLLNESSVSTLTWSLLIIAWLFSLLMSLATSGRDFARIVSGVVKKKSLMPFFFALPFVCVGWIAALGQNRMLEAAFRLSPLRLGAMVLTLVLLLIFGRGRKKCAQ